MLRNITVIYSGDKCFPRKQKWHWMWRFSNCVWTNTNIKQEHSTESRSALNVRIIQNKIWNAQQGKYFWLKNGDFLNENHYISVKNSMCELENDHFLAKNIGEYFFLEWNGLDTDPKMEIFGLKTTWNRFE